VSFLMFFFDIGDDFEWGGMISHNGLLIAVQRRLCSKTNLLNVVQMNDK